MTTRTNIPRFSVSLRTETILRTLSHRLLSIRLLQITQLLLQLKTRTTTLTHNITRSHLQHVVTNYRLLTRSQIDTNLFFTTLNSLQQLQILLLAHLLTRNVKKLMLTDARPIYPLEKRMVSYRRLFTIAEPSARIWIQQSLNKIFTLN